MENFRELKVWQGVTDLAVDIYKITEQNSFRKDFSLKDQIRRSAVSISSNIAEEDERNSNKESIRFLYIANGSVAELITQLEIAYKINYITQEDYELLTKELEEISKMIKLFISYRSKKR